MAYAPAAKPGVKAQSERAGIIMRKISWLALLVVLAVCGTYAHADSIIDVTLHFTVTSGSPTPTGSFSVDIDGHQTVKSFTVDWDGAAYNLAPANQVPSPLGNWCAVAPENVTSVCGGHGTFVLNDLATAPEDSAIFTDKVAAANGTYSYTFKEPPGVPEPATVGLLCLGLAGVGIARRRRKSCSSEISREWRPGRRTYAYAASDRRNVYWS